MDPTDRGGCDFLSLPRGLLVGGHPLQGSLIDAELRPYALKDIG